MDIDVLNRGVLRIAHGHGKRHEGQGIDEFSEVARVFENRASSLTGFKVVCEDGVRAGAIENIAIHQRHRLVSDLIVEGDLARGRSEGLFHKVGWHANKTVVAQPTTGL